MRSRNCGEIMFVSVFFLSVVLLHEKYLVECVTKTSVPIGGLFYEDSQASAFKHALMKRNTENLKLDARRIRPTVPDSYTTLREVCAITMKGGLAALIDGSETAGSCSALCQLCSKVNIPQLFTSWRPPEVTTSSNIPFGLSYHPQPMLISQAYDTLIRHLGWKNFTFLYENVDGLIRIQEILKSRHVKADPVMIRRMQPNEDNRGIFKEIKDGDNFIFDCNPENILKYLSELIEVNNHTEYQSYIFTSLDAHTIDLSSVKIQHVLNVSTLHMTDRDDPFWMDVRPFPMNGSFIKLETALAADAATHVSVAFENLVAKHAGQCAPVPAICQRRTSEAYEPWANGTTLLDELRQTVINGVSGNIEFNSNGYRHNFRLTYSIGTSSKFSPTGYWDSSTGLLTVTNQTAEENRFHDDSSSTKEIMVVSRIGKPYFDRKSNGTEDEFEGFAVDLIDAIFARINSTQSMKYTYKFYQVKENSYPQMINDLTTHKADLAICDLTMTSERQRQVDFSSPFMSLGISILFQKPIKEDPNKFSFLEPLALDLWLYLGTAYLVVSFVLLICARMSQEDWVNPHPCNRNPEALENIWDLYNCTWLAMGTIMTQGCDILPRAAGSRWVTGMWWFFALIVTASYTANMSTFLSNSRRNSDITSAKDLAEQNKIMYGTVTGQSTYKFFKNSNDSVYSKIFSVMESSKPSPYYKDNLLGLDRVLKGKHKFAFFMESTSIEYYIQRFCDLQMVGGRLDSKEYGIAMPRKSRLRKLIDEAILYLQENAEIEKIKKIWWEEKDNDSDCKAKMEAEAKEAEGGDSLQMKNTSGIFLVLFAGGFLGLGFALIEFLLHAHKIATKENVSWKEAIISEWNSSLDPRLLTKPVAPTRSAAPSLASITPERGRSTSRAVSVLRAAQSFINLDKVY